MSEAETTADKYRLLKNNLAELGSLIVAYSGGVDSTFLAVVSADVLGDRALAVTACSETYPERERAEAEALARQFGFRHRLAETSELGLPGYRDNPPDRCYHCKSELFAKLRKIADAEGIRHLADGATVDDLSDFRPGQRAAKECGAVSPLLEAGLTKAEVRILSRERGLPTADKASFACLASRIPYGETISAEKLRQVDEAEEFLHRLGFRQYRVRHHGAIARIEVYREDEDLLLTQHRAAIVLHLKKLGFHYITLDLEGYRTGSLNPKQS